MADTMERTRTATSTSIEKPAEALDHQQIKLSPGALKEIHSSDPAVAAETKVSKSIIHDMRQTVDECKNNIEVAKKFGLDDKVKLSAVDAAVAHAERTGKMPAHIDAGMLKEMKREIVRGKLQARAEALQNGQRYRVSRHNHGAFDHSLADYRQELLAMLLNNRQLAGLQKGSKTLEEVKEETGYGGEISGEKSVEEALQERIKFLLAEEQSLRELQEDRAVEEAQVEFLAADVDTGFATELRNQSEFGFLQDSEGLEHLLDGVVDIVPYIAQRRAQEVGRDASEIAAEVLQFQQLVQNRRKKGGLVTEEDCDTLLLVQYLPVLYDAVNYIMDKGLDQQAIAKMQSLKGELAALIEKSADPESNLHHLFKQIKDSLQDRELVEWTG